ncbi:MAG: carboxypeptidase regulatory-like domain-containing protein [Acidobacteriaceae bacterium]|nr:carboxypeptidase regulatory-like domain-containing protein [Acidobacteriaceae bacterium]
MKEVGSLNKKAGKPAEIARGIRNLGAAVSFASVTMLGVGVVGTACIAPAAYAQGTNATVRGTVTDATGALVAGASVSLKSQETKVVVYTGKTLENGSFVAPQIPPGEYSLTVTSPGMSKKTLNNITVSVSQTTSLDVALAVGSANEQVDVQATSTQQLDRESSNISTLISPAEVQNLPLQSRDAYNLLAIVPGIAHGGSATAVNSQQISINGSRSLNTELLLDGVSLVVPSTGFTAALPSPDGITEFRVLALNAPAEFGRTSGGVITVSTKYGTSDFHGNLYTLVRNEALNANSYANRLKNPVLARPRDRYYQFGGSIGGPLFIPKLYGRNHQTFFFINYDRTQRIVPTTSTSTVPSADWRTGNFSTATTTIVDPVTKLPLANNQVTAIDPAAAAIIARIPQANTTGTFDATNNRYTNNYTYQTTTKPVTQRVDARLDQQIRQSDRIFASVYRFTDMSPQVPTFNDLLLNTGYDCACSEGWMGSIGETHIFSPTLVSEIHMGFFRYAAYRNPTGGNANVATTFKIPSTPLDQLPYTSITGESSFGATSNTTQFNATNTYSPFGSVTKTWGPHTFKAGFSLRKNEFNSYNPASYINGSLNFTGEITSPTANSGNPANAMADFLYGKIKTGNYELPQPPTGRRNYNYGIYLQDDYRITPTLVVNAGVRYEYESPQTVSNNIYSRFEDSTGSLLVAGKNATNSLNITTPKLDFSPRVGFSWSAHPSTVVRGGFGMFYGLVLSNLGGQIAYPGYDVTSSYNNQGSGVAQPFTLSQGLPLNGVRDLNNPGAVLVGTSASNPLTVSGVQFGKLDPLSLVQQYNLGIEQQLPFAMLFELNYVGNHSVHLPLNIPINTVDITKWDAVAFANTTTATQNAKPFSNLGTWTSVYTGGTARYDSMQASLRRQFSTNLAFIMNYTWAKNRDSDSSVFGNGVPTSASAHAQYMGNSKLRALDYAASSFDIRNTLNIAVQYTTTGPAWLRGFKIAPIFIMRSGAPLNITQTNNIPNATAQRPNGSSNSLKITPYRTGSAIQYFMPTTDSRFPLTPSGPLFTGTGSARTEVLHAALGTLGRNSIVGPGEVNLDLSVSRIIPIYRKVNFQIRMDAFNVLNHVNLSFPSTTLTTVVNGSTPGFNSSSFGQITSAQPMRTMQIVGRINF